MKDYDKCCGLNGIDKFSKYNIMSKLFSEKHQNIINTGAKTVLTSCLGCQKVLELFSFGKYKVYDLADFLVRNIKNDN
jgi:Fe-S oxidoreductase